MDAERFDTFARSLTSIRSRRGALAALLGGTLGLLGLAETVAAKGKGKKGKGKKGRKKNTGGSPSPLPPLSPLPPPPPPDPSAPAPTCTDGIRNGDETDVDCGGTCPRCANGQGCFGGGQTNRNHCASASCSAFGYCFACSEKSQCPGDLQKECVCQSGKCIKNISEIASSCETCPANTGSCYVNNGTAYCLKLCGSY